MNSWSWIRLRRALITWMALCAVFVAVAVSAEVALDRGQARIAVEFLIVCSLVVSIQAYVGNTGLLSFGHVALFTVGAYVAGLAAMPTAVKMRLTPGLPDWLMRLEAGLLVTVLCALVAVLVFAVFTGVPISRMHRTVIPMATLALLVITHTAVNLWDGVTRGARGLVSVPDLVTVWVALVTAVLISGCALFFAASPLGLRTQVVREDPVAAAALGVRITLTRFMAWIISAALMAVGSAVWALNSLAFGPEQFFFSQTFSLLAMLVIGGTGSVTGAVAGAAVVSVVSEALRGVEGGFVIGPLTIAELPGLIQFVTAATILLILIWRPAGLLGYREVGGSVAGKGSR